MCPRRPGDPAVLVASSERARRELGWRPRFTGLDEIVRTALRLAARHIPTAMATDGRPGTALACTLAAAMLLWPALWNGYPLVFADTGTYLSQAIEHYAGWDRPIFYSLFLLPLHMTLTTWPAIAVQALLVVHVLRLVRRTLLPDASVWWLLPLAGAHGHRDRRCPGLWPSSCRTCSPACWCLCWPADFRARSAVAARARLAGGARGIHDRRAPIARAARPCAVAGVLLPLRHRARRPRAPMAGHCGACRGAACCWRSIALVSVNLAAFGRASLSPFGNVFLLARVIYDGPGMGVLRRDCPDAGWRLCAFVDRIPGDLGRISVARGRTGGRAGGAKLVSSGGGCHHRRSSARRA